MKEGWIKRIIIDGDRITEDGEIVLDPQKTEAIKKVWKEQQEIDLSIWGEAPDNEVLKFLTKGV